MALISACASSNPANEYAATYKPMAEAGTLPWSHYYQGAYDKVLVSQVSNQGRVLQRLNLLIMAAKSYENGAITSDQFHFLRREAQAENAADNQQEHARRIAALQQSLQSFTDNMNRQAEAAKRRIPVTTNTNCVAYGNAVNCTSSSY